MTTEMKIKSIAPWFGSNRSLASRYMQELEGCNWLGVPFAGGMSELPYSKARTILVNDLHRHVINLARVISDTELRSELIRAVSRRCFHPDELRFSQRYCIDHEPGDEPDAVAAHHYFVCCWMGRSHVAGTNYEFTGSTSIRWNSNGGDSAIRYRNVIRSIGGWSRLMKRCTFTTQDAKVFITKVRDEQGHGLFIDTPFPVAGDRYKVRMTILEHRKFAADLTRFKKTRVVMRFYDTEFIREIYPKSHWNIYELKGGRTQANNKAPEILIINGESYVEPRGLF